MLSPRQLALAVARLLRRPVVDVLDWSSGDVPASTGKATTHVRRLQGTARDDAGRVLPWRLVVKGLHAPDAGDDDACSPKHWTYWRREALAYESGLLPHSPDALDTVECLGVFESDGGPGAITVALGAADSDRPWDLARFAHAAALLGRWQAGWTGQLPRVGWLATDQLVQRIARTDAAGGLVEPDWGPAFPPDARAGLRAGWARRWSLLDGLSPCPVTLTHGDLSRANLFDGGGGRVVVIDWAALGASPAGFDLAHLVLSGAHELDAAASADEVQAALLDAYLGEVEPRLHASVRRAVAVSLALTATSRLCWALRGDVQTEVVEHWARLAPWMQANYRAAEAP